MFEAHSGGRKQQNVTEEIERWTEKGRERQTGTEMDNEAQEKGHIGLTQDSAEV